MYTLIIKGPRRATLAVHRCDSYADLRALLAIYRALGYADEAFLIEKDGEQQAA